MPWLSYSLHDYCRASATSPAAAEHQASWITAPS